MNRQQAGCERDDSMNRQQHINEASNLVAEVDAYRLGDLAMPAGFTVTEQLRLAELHIALANTLRQISLANR